jgi:hypothetical protein
MCACNPLIKTPFCGKAGCQWPHTASAVVDIPFTGAMPFIVCTRCSPSPCHCTTVFTWDPITLPGTASVQPPPPPRVAGVRVRQRPIELDAMQVRELRHAINRLTWKQTLPAWLVEAIGHQIIGIHWERTQVDGKLASADDWIIREPDGTLTVCTPEAFAAAFEVVA